MDYLDPKKQFRHNIMLMVGYVLVGIAIVIGTLVLLYQAYGFGLGKNGTVIQNGLFFFSSQPHPANIYVNGTLEPVRTNTRLSLPAGIYSVTLRRDGYRDWQRIINLVGGSVEHFDYPLLIPKALQTQTAKTYDSAPGMTTQSPDRRWLVVQKPGAAITDFEVYDLKNPSKAPVALTLPNNVLTQSSGAQSWQLISWADDNRHILLQHIYDGKSEFILADRTDPAGSRNLDSALSLPAGVKALTLSNRKYDKYYVYDSQDRLYTASLGAPSLQPYLEHVLAYQSYQDNTMLYVTDQGAPAGKVLLDMKVGDQVWTLRKFPAHSRYLLDLTGYSGSLYVVAGAASDNKVYIYEDPVGQLQNNPGRAPVPVQVLHVNDPNYVSFSDNAQFIVVEHSTEFGVYDIENEQAYHYLSLHALDKPQVHASWMDGDRLTYVSAGKMLIFDYDDSNRQVLMNASGAYLPAFTPDFKSVYTIAPSGSGKSLRSDLDRTWLLTPADR